MVGAFVVRDGTVLLGYRNPRREQYAATWDMIGGHVEPGESNRAAIRRELAEEIRIDVEPGDPLTTVTDDTLGVRLTIWRVTTWTGSIANRAPDEHSELRWFTLAETVGLAFPHPLYPALLERILS
jgi:8-oxo-dGTP diphosphatase